MKITFHALQRIAQRTQQPIEEIRKDIQLHKKHAKRKANENNVKIIRGAYARYVVIRNKLITVI